MSNHKIRKEEGQPSLKTLLKQNNTSKKRTPPSAEGPDPKKKYIDKTYPNPSLLQDNFKEIMEEETDQNTQPHNSSISIGKDTCFNNFSDEFIAFGKMMSEKLNEIVEPLKTSQDNMQRLLEPFERDMKLLLEDRHNNKNLVNVCDKVTVEQVHINKRCDKLEAENQVLKVRLNKLENKMLRKNLIFHGIKEGNWEDEESIKERVWKAIAHSVDEDESRKRLKIARRISINGVLHLGRYRDGQTRPISVSFDKQSHVETLFRNKKHLPKGIYIDREYTEETEKKRKILCPILRLTKSLSHYKGKSKLEDDALIVHGKKYTISNLHQLPNDINGFASASRMDTKTVAFFSELNPFSNFHWTPFDCDNKHYHSSEQYIQESKAIYFGDNETANTIMQAKTALECKNLAREVANYNHEDWKSHAKSICKPGLLAKFQSNDSLSNLLKSTGDKMLVESCRDQLWGNGIPLRDKDSLNRERWSGQGILEEILMEIREELSNPNMDQS